MLTWRITTVTVLFISLAACSSQPAPQDTAASQSTHSDGVVYASPKPPHRPKPSHDTKHYKHDTKHHGTAGKYQQPVRLASAGGDKMFRGEGYFNRLPDDIANSLRLRGLAEQNMSAYIRPANGGQALLTAYADVPRNPASTMKLVTTYSALGVLGPNYRWPTEIYTRGNLIGDTLQGDVIIKGYGNPDFRERDFRQLLQALRARGIRNIAGNFVIDKTYFSVPNQGSIDGNEDAAYNALPEALLYNERGSCYEIRGKAGQVQRMCPITPRNSNDLNTNLFGDFWRIWVGEMGGGVGGGLQIASLPHDAQLIHTHYSAPLHNIIVEINKDSNNVMARQLLLTMGAKQYGAPGTTQKGASVIGQFLESRGLRFGNLRIENGSGLSRMERISAREMGELLVDIYNSPYRHEMLSSMAVLGVDGTVKNRMKHLAGRGKFKTGTLRDVRALAGYLTAANGQPYVISILHNDANIRATAKEAHDSLVEWVYFGGHNNMISAR